MICKHCGKTQHDDDSKFCYSCGEPLGESGGVVKCKNCGTELKPTWKICPECQTPVGAATCKNCGAELKPTWKVCPECQTPVGASVQADSTEENSRQKNASKGADEEKYEPKVQACLDRADKLFENDDYKGAIRECTKAIELDPDCGPAYRRRGHGYFQQKKYDNAISDLSKAIQIDPDDSFSYFLRGLTYSFVEDNDSALKDFTKAIKIDGNDYRYYRWRGAVYRSNKNYKKAVSDFTRAIEMGQEDADVSREDLADLFFNRFDAYIELGNREMARADLEQAVELDPDSSDYAEMLDTLDEEDEYEEDESETISGPSGPCPICGRTAVFQELDTNYSGVDVNPIKALSNRLFRGKKARFFLCSSCQNEVVWCENCEAMVNFFVHDQFVNESVGETVKNVACSQCNNSCGHK